MAATDPSGDIRIIRKPTVYLIGRQTVDEEELDRFLADHGVSWQTDTEVAGEHLAEMAGRVCYMSFAKPRPGGNRAYLDHIKEVGHGSVLEHAVWNFLFVGASRALTHELVRHRAGMGYCLTGDTLVYSEHRLRGRRQGAKKRSLRRLFEMNRTPHGRSRLQLLRLRCLDESTGSFTTGKVSRIVCSGLMPVFRVTLEDGKTITCSKDHRFLTSSGWVPLHEVVGGLELSANKVAHCGSLDTPIATNGMLAYRERAWLQRHYHEQGLEQEEIARLAGVSPHTIRAWIRKYGLQKPTGSWTVGREPWNKGRRGAPPEAVAALEGEQPRKGRGRTLVPLFRKIRSIVYAGEQETFDIEMEGPHHNFVANGVVTHNSQLSQRYVDESVAEYVEPDCIAEDPELHAIWLDAVARTHHAYVKLVEGLTNKFRDEPDRTLRRKMARQAARSVLPNATETKIFVTANARALRHFIEMRASRHAEVEIRQLAVQVLQILQKEAPHLFGDYELTPLPDGTFEATTQHRKV